MDVLGFAKLFELELDSSKIVNIGRQCFYADDLLKNMRGSINRDIFSLGVFMGQDAGKLFEPSPALIDLLSKLPGADKRKIVVNEKAEGLFLYGRNILINSVSKNPNNITEGFVFVQNEQDENLGFGVFQTQGKDTVIKNLLDKGTYLRDEAKKKKKK